MTEKYEMNKKCYKCDNKIVLDLDKKDKTSDDYDLEHRYENTHYPICETCYNGSECFTCELCESGSAGEPVDYGKEHAWYGQREWWCSGCVIGELVGSETLDCEYVGQGHWRILGESK